MKYYSERHIKQLAIATSIFSVECLIPFLDIHVYAELPRSPPDGGKGVLIKGVSSFEGLKGTLS